MRQIGSFDECKRAQLFADYLESIGVRSQADDDGGVWTVWVREENNVDKAKEALIEFRANPDDAKYRNASNQAKVVREQEAKKRVQVARNTISMRNRWSKPVSRQCPLTMGLIATCVFIALVTEFGSAQTGQIMRLLGFCDFSVFDKTGDGFGQIRQGQLWRLLTPILMHGSPGHLIFNMLWLYSFGLQIEFRKKSLFFGLLVIACGIGSNLLQYFVSGNPLMLGISGVVYGLFGFIWAKQMYDPNSGFRIPESTILILVVWLILGFTGLLNSLVGGGIANWAHLGGLVIGMAGAFIPSRLRSD